ncbi:MULTISPECIES: bile acid:sodium symporter [Haloferax]|uniref:Sodium Bile acid symporter family protein n=1 Tax=Haloferax massiliensis TaxID=1476858 RepID=A0A0D6JU95_9EURY|nr:MULTISPECIES: bile acid:sodium symporter [Haloferax]MDS0241433.1 bile acid:sodium symporter [Haloferax sp. S2CR25]MDS0444554.1 bile acid:sodium symporter [Haloferax sp. S2CR25-2]CQR52110.1 Sodium Bile acid symporter family protein [Haloferax massiliensis]
MAVVLESLATLSVLVFVVTSMLAMGLSLTLGQILDPLKDVAVVAKALAANFVFVPVLGYALVAVVPMTEGQGIGLLLLATAAGAPFLPKLVEVAKGNVAFDVGVMVLLMVTTVAYVPLVLPLLLPGVQVNPFDIANSLILLMLLPLALGLVVNARYADLAASVQPIMAQTSTTALVFLVVLMLVLNVQNLLAVLGTGVLVALLAFVAGAFAIGYLLGGDATDRKSVLGLGTAQRNISAALVVGAQNFQDPDVLTVLLVGALVMLAALMVASGELGKRTPRERGQSAQTTESVDD